MDEIIEPLVRSRKQELIALAVVSQVAWWGGGTLAWYLTKRHYKKLYADLAEQEIAEAKEFYSRFYKREGFETPGEAVATLSPEGEKAVVALTDYRSGLQDGLVVRETTVEIEEKNLFEERESSDEWDQAKEEKMRAELSDAREPYIIHHDEYLENELDYRQEALVYFAEDDVLVDDKNQPIEAIDDIVGESNLTQFGHGSKDNRMVYIRNDHLSMDFEIIKNDGSYARDVLGFQHSDRRPGVLKFRGGDE